MKYIYRIGNNTNEKKFFYLNKFKQISTFQSQRL